MAISPPNSKERAREIARYACDSKNDLLATQARHALQRSYSGYDDVLKVTVYLEAFDIKKPRDRQERDKLIELAERL